MKNLFVYGTLMNEGMMERFTGQALESQEASLEGFKCGMVRGAGFPGITPSKGCTAPGLLFFNVPDDSFTGLDRYEGCPTLYKRETVVIETEYGIVEAETYVFQSPESITDIPFVKR